MIVVNNFENLIKFLKDSFKYRNHEVNHSRVAGLLFAQPNNFTSNELLSSINYFNNRSGKTIDFFWIGYQPAFFDRNLPEVANLGGTKWAFNSEIFNNLRTQIEERTKWKYSGSVELILFNVNLDRQTDKVELDFSDALSIDLIKAKNSGLINSVGELFEKIFIISETISTNNPTQEVSKKLIIETGKMSIVDILFNLLPKVIQKEVKKIYLFSTNNYEKQ